MNEHPLWVQVRHASARTTHDFLSPTGAALLAEFSQAGKSKPKTSMKKRRKFRVRAPGMTQISISLPEHLVGKIDEMADAENRNRSNFIANALEGVAVNRGVLPKKAA